MHGLRFALLMLSAALVAGVGNAAEATSPVPDPVPLDLRPREGTPRRGVSDATPVASVAEADRAGDLWTSGGPFFGDAACLAMAPSSPSTVYLGTSGGVYRSTDDGATWHRTALTGVGVDALAVDPTDAQRVYAGGESGVHRSADGGASWTLASLVGVTTVTVDNAAPATVWAGTVGGRILKSTDGGSSWVEMHHEVYDSEVYGSLGVRISTVLIDPESSSTIFAATSGSSYGGLLKSTDGGASWQSIHLGATGPWGRGNSLVTTPPGHTPQTLYVITNGDHTVDYRNDVYRSTDKGETWDELYLVWDPPAVLAVDPEAPQRLYVATHRWGDAHNYPMLVWHEGEQRWYDYSAGLPALCYPTAMAYGSPAAGDVGYVTFGGCPLHRAWWLEGWQVSNDGIGNADVLDIAAAAGSSSTAYVAGGAMGLQMTETGGASWTQPNAADLYGSTLYSVAMDPTDPSRLLAGTQKIHSSADGGATWTIGASLTWEPIRDLLIHATDPSIVLAVADDGNLWPGGVFRSDDGGTSWTRTMYWWRATCLAADPASPDTVYLGVERRGYLFISTDSGVSWTDVGGLWWSVRDVVVDSSSQVYVATKAEGTGDGSVWTRVGAEWRRLLEVSGAPVEALAIDPSTTPETLFAGADGAGVFVSQDGGATWGTLNQGLGILRVASLEVSTAEPTVLYAGTVDGGAWTLQVPDDFSVLVFADGFEDGTTGAWAGTVGAGAR